MSVNTFSPRQNCRHFADDIFKCLCWISLTILLKSVSKFRISNIPALFQIMAWRRPGDKPLSEPMMVSLLTHICVTRPQRVKVTHLYPVLWQYFYCSNIWRDWGSTIVQCDLFTINPDRVSTCILISLNRSVRFVLISSRKGCSRIGSWIG